MMKPGGKARRRVLTLFRRASSGAMFNTSVLGTVAYVAFSVVCTFLSGWFRYATVIGYDVLVTGEIPTRAAG